MADLSGSGDSLGALENKAKTFEVHDSTDIVQGGILLRSIGFKSAACVDYIADGIQDALDDDSKARRTRLGAAKSKAVVRGLRIYAAGLRQADRVGRAMVNKYSKEYAEEIAAARRKGGKPKFSHGTK